MVFFSASGKTDFHQQLREALARHVEPEVLPRLARFAEQFFAIAPLEELLQHRLADLEGSTLSAWRLLEAFRGEPLVRVFNPDYEQHGWQSTHSVVQVLHPDMPFLVDSVRMALNRRGHSIHTLQNSVLSVRRGAAGELLDILPRGSHAEGARDEALMFLEIDRCASTAELRELQQLLSDVLAEVRLAVGDYPAMQEQVRRLLEHLAQRGDAGEGESVGEVRAFYEWLLDHHFTFLGYEEFRVLEDERGARIEYDEGSLLGLSRVLRKNLSDEQRSIEPSVLAYLREPCLLSFAKASQVSRVHRSAYPDLVSLRMLDDQGRVVRECRFLGLYTSMLYTESVTRIPYVRRKAEAILGRSGFARHAHLGKELAQVLEVLPRDELFQTPVDELYETAIAIVQIQERNKLRLFLRKDPYGRFVYCLVYVPRDHYSTEIRVKIQNLLMERLNASDCEFWTYFSESVLARVQLILRVDPRTVPAFDARQLEQEVIQACRSWQDEFASLMVERFGEARGTDLLARFAPGFPAGYRERFEPHSAVADMQHIRSLSDEQRLVMSFYQPLGQGEGELHCKIYHADLPLPLSDVLPILENLGLRVLGEYSHRLRQRDGRAYWIHDFTFAPPAGLVVDLKTLNGLCQEAFTQIIAGNAENDAFNRLVLGAGLTWREVALLRAYGRYLKQIRIGFDLGYIAATLNNHTDIALELVRLFKTRFYLARKLTAEALEEKQGKLEEAIRAALDQVAVLNEDRILRRYLELIGATLRSNFYQTDAEGRHKPYFSFKISPGAISEMPRPVPLYEIFVYSPRVEGVHLRFGPVARGGLRWSDREEDFRTEVLGLVKAQQVKNAVIVPMGAKGGFVPRRLPVGGSRDEIQAEAIACYRLFISGLLDITDNYLEGRVVPPEQVVRHDGDDPYLVVAADKGTASFSDIANGIAAQYGFWLGDAFASGGSAGYDHKKMGITARGAWVSVQRHFRERGIDVQRDSITVIGIGDMSGDVFGNGLLMSERVQLLAAFNHLHIFVDPDPDPAASYAERKRLFELPRSSWADYDAGLISAGGGVFPRSAKSIAVSPQMRERFDIQAEKLSPNELVSALLRAPVDLLWNGGIGTYVKASTESHADIGDKANDPLRIDGRELRARVVGEGGNLGMSQLGRIEYCLNGGACNTDFIDNAGGVNCSDHEVNIKILLNGVLVAGDMTGKQRNQLLAQMTDDVAQLVLGSNYTQTQALSLAERRARERMGEYRRLMSDLESRGRLDRALEFLPSDEQLGDRALTRPELAVLLSYSKIDLKQALLDSSVPDDDYLVRDMQRAFPPQLVERFGEAMRNHRLRREIVATQIANDLVDRMGITFAQRLCSSTGMGAAQVAEAYVIVRDVFHLPHWYRQIESLDYGVSADTQLALMDELMRLGRRATRWFLRSRRQTLDAARDVAHFGPPVATLGVKLDELLQGAAREQWQERHQAYAEAGVPELLARMVAASDQLYMLLPILEVAERTGHEPLLVARAFFAVGSALDLDGYLRRITHLAVNSHWQAQAREAFRDELDSQQREITLSLLSAPGEGDPRHRLESWLEQRQPLVQRWETILAELRGAGENDYALHAVASRELADLARSG
ncbi:NAD-specific glutamate dehydrogenase [Pseudomonas flexibilis]|uniref:Glutamate dehydrogenase (NAD) n=1 Tax=Pseudomonas flexibilis TaxID=706570 RepID=A0A1N6R4K0_9PSED|nr:NAD-glutamate dehydrogenase [Pseudomonas flexibilis]KHL68687.1 NAD-specific glutamate dehydrogenase [Pseudomonas flexibilis]SIQ23737.1 glutamate dehydrogenase (NAD) [Pseudomonas flexibilis]